MEGLNEKYSVSRTGGGPVNDAFVLRVRSDPAGWLAAWYYATMTYNMELARDLRQWLLDNTPDEGSLGSEGKTNEALLTKVADMVNAPNALPGE